MAGTLITDSLEQLQQQRKGYIAISLTDFDLTSVSQIALGSRIEISGSVIKFTANESMGSNWAAMSAGIVYAYINGTTYVSTYTATAPIWNTEKQGWYDATGAHRYYAKLSKNAVLTSLYFQKTLYSNIRNATHTAYGISLDTGIDDDKLIYFAEDVALMWDESESRFSINRPLKHITGLYVDGSLHGDDVTSNTIFDTLSPFIPTVNNEMIVCGSISKAGGSKGIVSKAVRTATDTITFYIMAYDFSGTTTETAVNGNTTLNDISIVW